MAAQTACIGEPVSWLRLESMALGERDASATAHLEACAACRSCMDEIRGDVVALPALHVPERVTRRPAWLRWAIPAFGLAAAAALALLVVKPRGDGGDDDNRVAAVKGVGEVVVDLVRERDGSIAMDATTSRAGDRWKVVVTCAPGAATWIDVAVTERGASSPDYPLAPARVACGNRVVVPGAFALTGTRANRICARLGAGEAPPRDGGAADGTACMTVLPE